eukprot:TRINITY_DN20252_c0_g1_i3.p1 TRINITY_DN20252_c0_g1~~TRINITY_DN20252_c0_g1_i3.p1  ORF type:complete len:988 (-),score=346.56 TRINITY_DN20252_c0_g1_i3:228-3191(-)
MLEPTGTGGDFSAFGGKSGEEAGGGVEDELDAFNDETFGGEEEWVEETHEELAQLTEEERKALKDSQAFFELDGCEGEALEAEGGLEGGLEDGLDEEGTSGLDEAADQLLGALKPKVEKDISENLGSEEGIKQQFQQLSLAQVAAPLTIETSDPSAIHLQQHQQLVYPAPPHHHHNLHIIQQPQQQHFHVQQQQVYNLMPPGHFQQQQPQQPAGPPQVVHHHHPHMQQAAAPPLQDPAIMSFSKIPVISGFPGTPVAPAPHHIHHAAPAAAAAHHHHLPAAAAAAPPPLVLPAAAAPQQQPPNFQQPPQQPPTVMGFKTMQDLENEMLYGKPPQNQQQGPRNILQQGIGSPVGMQAQHQPQFHHQHHQNQAMKQQMLNNRNLNYPGMRDRQQHQAPRGNMNNNHEANFHGHSDRDRHFHHNQRNNMRDDARRNQNHEDYHRNNRPDHHHNNFNNHRQQQDNNYNNRHNHHNQNDMGYNNRHQNENYRQPGGNNGGSKDMNSHDDDDNNWRWNEVRNRNRDSATRRDLMPGHVHTLGILRHSRAARHHHNSADHNAAEGDHEDDDCLGASDSTPLINPTGDPRLDARLLEEQEELQKRARWFNETEDEYAGLMSARDKQFIINIQLNQLKCDNPYVDDYYYTMFIAKKQKLDESERTGQMLLSDNSEQENAYKPLQFENSLGKLQAVSVKAPRQIIDVAAMKTDEVGGANADGSANNDADTNSSAKNAAAAALPVSNVATNTKNKRGEDYKSTLLQLERVYTILLDIESLKLKLSAIPTGVPLREQVTMDLTRQVQALATHLAKPGLIPLYLQISKGRGLLARALKHLPSAPVARISQEILVHLWLVCKDTKWVELMWSHLYRHSSSSSLGNLEAAVNCWVKGKDSALNTVLTSPLGVSTVLATLFRATSAAKRGQEKICVGVWRDLIMRLITWYQAASGGQSGEEASPLGAPLVTPPQPIDIGFLLTLPDKQLQTWEAILASVGLEK